MLPNMRWWNWILLTTYLLNLRSIYLLTTFLLFLFSLSLLSSCLPRRCIYLCHFKPLMVSCCLHCLRSVAFCTSLLFDKDGSLCDFLIKSICSSWVAIVAVPVSSFQMCSVFNDCNFSRQWNIVVLLLSKWNTLFSCRASIQISHQQYSSGDVSWCSNLHNSRKYLDKIKSTTTVGIPSDNLWRERNQTERNKKPWSYIPELRMWSKSKFTQSQWH